MSITELFMCIMGLITVPAMYFLIRRIKYESLNVFLRAGILGVISAAIVLVVFGIPTILLGPVDEYVMPVSAIMPMTVMMGVMGVISSFIMSGIQYLRTRSTFTRIILLILPWPTAFGVLLFIGIDFSNMDFYDYIMVILMGFGALYMTGMYLLGMKRTPKLKDAPLLAVLIMMPIAVIFTLTSLQPPLWRMTNLINSLIVGLGSAAFLVILYLATLLVVRLIQRHKSKRHPGPTA